MGRGGMGGGTLLMGLLSGFFERISREWFTFFPNCNATLSRKEVLPDVCNLSQPDSKMADMKVHAESPNRASWGMSLPSRSSRFRCLRKEAIRCREQAMLRTSL